jgi:hypothetical protein
MPRQKPLKKTPPRGNELQEFRKTNSAIGLRVSEGRLSLLSRKIFNIMVYRAQQSIPGKDAPIESETAQQYFWMPLGDVARDAAYDSNDTELLKAHLQELQDIKVVVEDAKQWTSERLVSSVKIVNPQGLHKRGGMVWFGFAFPPEVAGMVMNPSTYTKLSLYYQTMVRSGAALALYEICRRYATNPTKVTHAESWEWWHGALTGNPVRDAPPEYKYFKRDTIKPAIAEINAVTDISVELLERKQGRRVMQLQFRVGDSVQAPIEFPAPPVIHGELVARIQRLGFSAEEAADLSVMHPEERLKAALAKVAARMKARNSPALDSPAAYFKWALKQPVEPQSQAAKAELLVQTGKQTAAAEPRSQADDALALFDRLDADKRDAIVERFRSTKDGQAILRVVKKPDSPVMRRAMASWLAKDLAEKE